jgi:hypothetical protein
MVYPHAPNFKCRVKPGARQATHSRKPQLRTVVVKDIGNMNFIVSPASYRLRER